MKTKITIIIFFSLFLTFSLFIFNFSKQNPTLSSVFSFYKENLKEEYLRYQEKHNLSIKQSIIYVNIGLNYPFYENTKEATRKNQKDILVNKYHYVTKDYIPNNLIPAKEYCKNGVLLNEEAYNAFTQMAKDALNENLHLRIISGYRDYAYQEKLYNNYLKNDSQEKVDSYSARPGYSEHHTGLAIDLDNTIQDFNHFHLTKEFSWLKNNAHKYGFILRYPLGKEKITGYKYEPWHYRYIGQDIATYIYQNNITFEEYYAEFIND